MPVTGSMVRSAWLGVAPAIGLVALGAVFFFTDMHEISRTVGQARGWMLTLPVLCVLVSYLTMALSYQGISTAAGYPIPLTEMLKITFVANTVNYLVATGGLSGFAVRMYFFTRRAIPSGAAVVISLAQTFLTNATMLLLILVGFLYLFVAHNLSGVALPVAVALLALFTLIAVVIGLLLFHARLRRRTLFVLGQLLHLVLVRFLPHRAPPRTHIWRYQFNLNRGIAFLVGRKRQMVAPLFFIILDWTFTLLVLYTAFLSIRYPLPIGYVVVGFALGMVLSLVSVIPGGLGIMEGGMAAVYASLGVPFETAVVAVLIYRVTYYVLPLLFSLFFLHGMFVQGTHVRREAR